MKEIIKAMLIIIAIPIALITIIYAYLDLNFYIKKYRSYDKIYATKNDKELAQLIENSIMQIAVSKSNEWLKNPNENTNVKDLKVEIKLDNIKYVCPGFSVYSTSVPDLLEDINVEYKYVHLIEDKKQIGYGEGSSVILFVKDNDEIIPIFVGAYFFDLRTKFEFPNKGYRDLCAEIPKRKLNIKIKPGEEDKALLILE